MRLILAAALMALAIPAYGQDTITGKALALDGDTILLTPHNDQIERIETAITNARRANDTAAVKTLIRARDKATAPITVRLWGVDAPDMKVWPWGPWARTALDQIIGGWLITCEIRGKSHKRLVALCTADTTTIFGAMSGEKGDQVDLGLALVARGLAVEHRVYGKGFYRGAEGVAQIDRAGIWRDWEGPKH